ncbi:sodium bicarbonate cotransporter 3 isoform X6 [Amblyraja radiata]|uniref:sodium bicarbonate cotransporter 3 isoform X6 n=1 Tax=Amblyraja radiata TaxID=386614 RepID=UPI00140369AA|nr:sodium bicarbonate cotransporter 3 isoform X6 [Amblyraja radiata]
MEEDGGEQMRPLLTVRHDDEAIVDLGKTSTIVNTNFEKEELESHRAVYIGVHVPFGKQSRRRHRHRGHKHHHKKKGKEKDSDKDDGRESPSYDTPSQRVQFILGIEDDDEEHMPHDLFTELDELCFRDGEDCEWKETARWLKFEEDVEDGGERWSKPYVATLSLHSLFELRSCILNGTVMLDMRASTTEEIADMVLDNMIASEQLDETMRDKVREALLRKHHHQSEKKLSNRIPIVRSFADIGKKHSDPHLLERNGDGLSASRLSLRAGLSASHLSLRGASLFSVPFGSFAHGSKGGSVAGSTPVPTPQNTPPSSPKPEHRFQGQSQLLVSCAGEDIPDVVVHPPEEEFEVQKGHVKTREEWAEHKAGILASPQSAPGILETKSIENKTTCNSASRENSTVDFSKVDMNFMKKIPAGAEASNVLVGEVNFLERPIIAFVRLSPAILLTGLTEVPIPTRFLFLMLGPSGKAQQYHEIGRSIATLMTDEIFHDVAYKAKDRTDLLAGIDEFLDQVTVLPPGEWDPSIRIEPPKSVPSQEKRKCPPLPNGPAITNGATNHEEHHTGPELKRTGRIFGGLIHDIKRKSLFYLSDFKDAISLQCLASILFLYCACMSPVITFGGLLGEATENRISAMESLFGASMTGIQTCALPQECHAYDGMFVGSACGQHGPYVPDVLFWSIILFFSTFFLCSYLKQFKTKRYFPTKVRAIISDFAVFLTILTMALIDFLVGVPSPKLAVPDRFEPTRKDRGWFIDPLGRNQWWTMLAAFVPALLCTILIFMDQQITAVIVNRKEHKLKKGCGYHLDLLMVAIMLGVCSIMGLPWFVAATVLSISHVNSLKVESECSAPGEQPKFLGIREQRVTGLLIFVLMGLSVFMTSVLKFIPMPVLYGVFLYMGASSLKGIQLFDRLQLFGMPAKHQPDLIYLRYVPLWKVHIFTVIQLTCLALLWIIKTSSAAVVFPMMVLALVFIRKLLDFFFNKRELGWLDDLMPESKKKKLEDLQKKKKETEKAQRMLEVAESGTVQLPLEGGNILKIPVKSIKYSPDDPSVVNISDEMAKSAVWKALAMNAQNAKVVKLKASPENTVDIRMNIEEVPRKNVLDAETSV